MIPLKKGMSCFDELSMNGKSLTLLTSFPFALSYVEG